MRHKALLLGAVTGLALGAAVLGASRIGTNTGAQTLAAERPLPPDLLEDERNTIEVFRRTSRSVVFVTNTALARDRFTLNVVEIPQGSGSGFVWDSKGHVVTNFHVVRGGQAFTVTLADGKKYPATLVGVEPFKDLSVLRIDAPASSIVPLALGDSDHLVVGQKVLAIGNPFGFDQTLTTGIISALGREIKSIADVTIQDVIQTDASINPGNSGGPLLDSAGRVIGLNTAIYSPTGASAGIGFAVPVSAIQRVVPQLIEHGKVTRAGLGVSLVPESITQRWGIRGLVIRSVQAGSAAERAGLKGLRQDRWGDIDLGDVIVAVAGNEVSSYDDLYQVLDPLEPGDRVKVRVRYGDRERDVEVTLQEVE
jgi:S1-C subfamily serine protease